MTAEPWLILRTMRLPHAVGDGERSRMQIWLDNVAARGFETYYPMISELKRVPRRGLSHAQRTSGVDLMRHRVVPFLPQLVFVRGANPLALLRVPGAIGFVGFGEEPARVADVLIGRLRAREREGGGAIPGATPAEFIFRAGDAVRVVNGPFATRSGIVEEAPHCALEEIDATTRLRLTIDLFGRATSVELAVADVAKL